MIPKIHFYHMTYFTTSFLLQYNLFVHVLVGKTRAEHGSVV